MFYPIFIQKCNEINQSPSAVAVACGISRAAVNRWKNGSIPSDAKLFSLANFFNCPVEDFFPQSEKPAPTNGDGHTGDEEVILEFLRSLPKERLRGILLALGAPEAVLASADRIDTQG